MFEFNSFGFDYLTSTAEFYYQGPTGIRFLEKIEFTPAKRPITHSQQKSLMRALFLAFITLGTSYYKANPTRNVKLHVNINQAQADFFTRIYQEGLSQFAFENHLTRNDLAKFELVQDAPGNLDNQPNHDSAIAIVDNYLTDQDLGLPLVLLSGGKDSLLTAEKLSLDNIRFKSVYISNNDADLPEIVSSYGEPLVIRRHIDKEALKKAGGLNGHVPITLINESLALVQAILADSHEIYLGLGREGEEPHAYIDDLPVNHQWSKTPATQRALKSYIQKYVSSDVKIQSLLENKSELEIAGEFVKLCWDKFGSRFSSCNVANYKQGANNQSLKWCGKCPKCANSFLLFAPYLPLEKQPFDGRDLFLDPDLTDIFKGLLGVDGHIKPFECVGTIAELREAYSKRDNSYGALPFEVPES